MTDLFNSVNEMTGDVSRSQLNVGQTSVSVLHATWGRGDGCSGGGSCDGDGERSEDGPQDGSEDISPPAQTAPRMTRSMRRSAVVVRRAQDTAGEGFAASARRQQIARAKFNDF